MVRRRIPVVIAIMLWLMTYGWCAAAPAHVWVALAEPGGVHAEAADSLRAELERGADGRVEVRVAPWQQFARLQPEPSAVVAVGTVALRAMQEQFAADPRPPLVLAILVPRVAFERIVDPARVRAGLISAIFLDQPPGRQLDLVRLALPGTRQVGVLVGTESRSLVSGLERAARERSMQLHVQQVGSDGVFPALQSALSAAEALLAVPDPGIFNSQTAASILAASYRRRVPLVGFSPAYARAGALVSLFSQPAQSGVRGGELLRNVLAGQPLPGPQWPRDFSIAVNADVARSLGLSLDEKQLHDQLRQKERQ